MAEKETLEFHARVTADIKSVKDVITELKDQLNKLEMPKNTSKGFEKSLENLNTELQNFEALASKGVDSLADTKKIDASWRKITTIFSSLGVQIKDLENVEFFSKEVVTNIEKANKALASYQTKVEEIKKSQPYKEKIEARNQTESKRQAAANDYNKEQKKLGNLERDVAAKKDAWTQNHSEDYADQSKKLADLNSQIKQQNKALEEQQQIQKQLQDAKVITKEGNIRDDHKRALAAAKAKKEELETSRENAQKEEEAAKKQEEAAKKAQKIARAAATRAKKNTTSDSDPKLMAAIEAKTKAEQSYAEAKAKSAEASANLKKIEQEENTNDEKISKLEGQEDLAKTTAENINAIKAQKKALESASKPIKEAVEGHEAFKQSLEASEAALQDQQIKVQSYKTAMETAEQAVDGFDQELKQLELDGSADEWAHLTEVVKGFTGVDLSNFQGDINQITQILEDYRNGQIKDTPELIKKLQNATNKATPAIKHMGDEADNTRRDLEEMGRAEREMENLKNQVLDFFSITNTIQIFKNAVHDAFNTVKELDAAMTQTAVVTDFSVSDMWDKLPEYSEQATKLGASIKSLYEATTLYYQQGLNSEQAMSVGIETMKMARIANMDAAQATEAMTAALRGFNMEINETSATRINDVYSELAAITAADTSQIATAMSKTASIAESANMEFETTAALLAQIIETTQEAPETAGTAMKTIIARFTEVKKLFSEGMLSGEDAEGEAIDINKIDAALKTVGISLKDFLSGAKGIDDIFLELASKWDTLDLATQRYIATTAAGSRQQSRFLAMMGNYDRTMELVAAANNSAEASARQFDKTLESLDSKLQRLQNAWAEFTMGLANNEIIKFGVDLLTEFINVINKITEALPGATGNIAKLLLTIGGLKAGGAIFDSFFQNLKKVGPEAMGPFQALTNSISSNFSSLKINIVGLFNSIKAMGGLSGTIKTLGSAFFSLEGSIRAASVAQLGFDSALAASPIGWIVIAIAAAIAAIYGLVKAWQAASDAFKLNAINDSINQMTSNIEGAKQAIDDLKDSKTTLRTLQNEFQGLARGTQAWKEKLIEVNQQVLDLLEKYPELSSYITRTDFGTLSIKEEGWDLLIAAQEKTLANTTSAKIGMQYMRSDLQEKIDYEELLTSALGRNFGESIDTTSFGANVGTALGTAIGSIGMGLFGSLAGPGGTAAGIVTGGLSGSIIGNDLGAQWGQEYQQEIQKSFSDIGEWTTQAFLDTAAFLDTGWGKVAAGAFGGALAMGSIGLTDYLNGEYSLEESAQRALGSGFTQNEISSILAALGEAQITFDADSGTFSDPNTLSTILNGLGFEASIEQVTALAKKLGASFNELTLSAQKYELAKEGQRDGLMLNAISNSSIAQESYADAVGNILGETIYENIEPMLEQKKDNLTNDKKELKKLYAQEVGGHYENGKLYSDASMSTEWDLSKETMKSAIASAQVAKDMGVSIEAMATVLNELGANERKLFSELFARDGAGISSSHFENYMTTNGLDLTKILTDMGFNGEDAFKQFVEKFGVEAGQLLLDNFNMAADRITKARVDLAKKMRRSNKKDANDFASEDEYIASELKRLEDTFGSGIRDTLNSIFETLSSTGDQALVDTGYQKFMEVSQTGSSEDLKNIQRFVEEVDWTNPIQAVKQLNHEVKYGSSITSDYAKSLLEVGSSAFDGGAQMRYLLKSADFTDMSEDIEEIIEKQGELSAMDVLDLADSYEELNDIMENTEVTAAGLAKLLEQIANDELSLDKITDVVVAAMKGFESLDSYVAEVLKGIKEFDWGENENDVNDFMSETWEDIIVPNIEAGRFNNSQLNKWMNYIAGSGWDTGLSGDARKNIMVEYAKEWKKYVDSGDFSQFYERAAANQTFLGESKTVDTSAGSKYQGLDVVANADGSYSITGYEGYDIKTIEEFLAEQLDVTKEMAAMALVDMRQQNTNREMDEYFTAQDLNKGLTAALKEAETTRVFAGRKEDFDTGEESAVTYNNKKIVDKSEIDAIVAAYGEEYETAIRDFFSSRAVITNFYDEDGVLRTAEEIAGELDKVFSSKAGAEVGAKWIEGFATRTSDGRAIINWDEVVQGMADANVPEQIRTQVGEAMLEGLDQEVPTTLKVTLSDGSLADIEITPNIDINTAIANAERDMELGYLENSITSAIQAAFGTDELKINFTEESAAALTAAIEAAVPDEIPTTVNYVPNTSALPNSFEPVYRSVIYQPDESQLEPEEEHARGIKNSPTSHLALVSEEGPELIQTEDGFYLTGQNGPELAYINKGDTVYTAKETTNIMDKKKHKVLPRFSKGITGYGGGVNLTGGGSGGSSKSDDKDAWENPFDKLYNLVRKIDEELRQRERIERRYEKLLEGLNVSANKIINVSREELAQLERERMLQEKLQTGRRYQIEQYQSENADLTKYANVVQNDRGEDILRINWDLINSVTDTDEGSRIEDYVSQLEEWFDSLEEAEDALWDIEDTIQEIKERGEEEYFDMEDTIKEALTQSYQDEIDKLSQINESINDTNSSLLDAIQKSIDKQRQDRDNQRTEDDLAEKQRRLLYLQQDTSGANAMEILKLQEEITQGQEDYTDTLIDQKISELQEQNDEAAKQREQQITIAQAQLDHYIETGRIWQEVYGLMDDGLDRDNGLVRGSRLEAILKNAESFKGMSEIAKMEWMNDTNNMIAQALAYLEIGRQLEDIGMQSGSQIEFTTSDGRKLTGTVNEDGSVTASDGKTYNNVFQGYDGKYYAGENIADVEEPEVEGATNNQSGNSDNSSTSKKNNPYGVASSQGYYTARRGTMWGGNSVKSIQWALNDMGYNAGTIDGGYGYATAQAVSRFQSAEGIQVDGDYGPQTREKMRLRGYKTGGLAEFTGPAWLDGTKARPELVLNQKDTQNFIQLKDILASLMTGSHTSTENNGDITYDIDINVESISSDYDVEQVANKIKSLINEDARYRNNNTVSLKR